MEHKQAYAMAEWLLEKVRPACETAEIGGSLRRGKADVHDLEIVCIPHGAPRPEFGRRKIYKTQLDKVLDDLEFDGALIRSKGGEKFKQYVTGRWEEFGFACPLIPFMAEFWIVTPPASWGVQYMIRTGPAEFSQYMVTQTNKGGALPDLYRVEKGAVWEGERKIEVPTEQDYFDLCGMRYIEPNKRVALWGRSLEI
jgi:DNA polymerase/3'-5' exonuclease PolX